jgi:hypothetical protein
MKKENPVKTFVFSKSLAKGPPQPEPPKSSQRLEKLWAILHTFYFFSAPLPN